MFFRGINSYFGAMLGKRKFVAIIVFCVVVLGVRGQDRPLFAAGHAKGKITNDEINEASGLVASAQQLGLFWTHNDSGDAARIFLIDAAAKLRATYYLDGIVAHDWEDIGMMERNGRSYLLVGDIGDNRGRRASVQVHLFEEPLANDSVAFVDTIPKARITTYVLQYENGPRDAESLFFDPIDKYLYLISKRELQVGIYRTALPEMPTDTLVLEKVGALPHTFINGADISRDGSEVLAKNLLNVFYWRRRAGESMPQMLERPALQLPYRPEPQGEAIAFSPDGEGYYTLSESALGMNAILYFYRRLSLHHSTP